MITSNTIVRCRSCRTYINPFVTFLDQRRWKCNLCYRVNDGRNPLFLESNQASIAHHRLVSSCCLFLHSVPDEFMYNPVTRSYGEPHKRPEVQNSTVEFIASSDYMVRFLLQPLEGSLGLMLSCLQAARIFSCFSALLSLC